MLINYQVPLITAECANAKNGVNVKKYQREKLKKFLFTIILDVCFGEKNLKLNQFFNFKFVIN